MLTKSWPEIIQVTGISARLSRYKWSRLTYFWSRVVVKRLYSWTCFVHWCTFTATLCALLHEPNYLEMTYLWELKRKDTNLPNYCYYSEGPAGINFSNLHHCLLELWGVAALLPDTFAIIVTDFCYNHRINIKNMLLNAQMYCISTSLQWECCRC